MSNYKRIYKDGYSYFITIVTHRREPILIDNIALLRKSFALSKKSYSYSIDAIIILPDHLHMIITPTKAKEYSKIVSHIKRSFVYGLDGDYKQNAKMTLSNSSYRRKLSGIWQKRFYEHTIRDEKDWLEKISYIKYNAVKHKLVEVWDDWEYSSFVFNQ
ncbi:MAG: transposase [Epsilonproteobacteria bacterium]|nr:MAG: transposase [Campylobacterota bacterium]